MTRNFLLALATVGAFSVPVLPACAQAVQAGFVSPSGVVSGNNNFIGSHTGTGAYILYAHQSLFPSGFPIMTVTPFGEDGGYVAGAVDFELCENGWCEFGVHLLSIPSGKPQDNGWMFTVNQAG